MSGRCSICSDSRVDDINALLAAGKSARAIGKELGLGHDSINRHRAHAQTTQPMGIVASDDTDPLAELVAVLRLRALDGTDPAASREYRLALQSLQEKTAERPTYNVLTDPEWLKLRTVMGKALLAFPEARQAVADALRDAE